VPLTETMRAPVAIGAAVALEYRQLVVPIIGTEESEQALDLAFNLAADKGATVTAVTVIEVPLELPLDTEFPEREAAANVMLDDARAAGELHGLRVITRLVRDRDAGEAIVRETASRQADIVVLGSPRSNMRSRVFGSTVDYVLRHAPSRVMVAAAPRPATASLRVAAS